ncbi:MAG: hypothetical protein COA45_02025 [Zetaproteobacteria bacterium]|nr:MAG: hypothetical protein COA45_02025 [Zetaproteobacteria bacterium]
MDADAKAIESLKQYAGVSDKDIDLGGLALAMVALDHDGISVDRYVRHFQKMSDEARGRYDVLICDGAQDDAGLRLAALKYTLSDIHDYRVDDIRHEALESADIMRVIDRAKGCSSALCLLYIDVARKAGWLVEGLNFPNLFLCRLEYEGVRLIFDPSQQCKVLEAHELRAIVKNALGEQAELSTDYYDGLGAREIVIHLCNHLKHRRIAMGDYCNALNMVLRMRMIVPDEYRLLLDAGVLCARLNRSKDAVEYLNEYITQAPDVYDRQEAELLLDELLRDL